MMFSLDERGFTQIEKPAATKRHKKHKNSRPEQGALIFPDSLFAPFVLFGG